MKKNTPKKDGHTHSYYCLHGSGEETEAFILEAIRQGFEEYSVTEHLPLPSEFLRHFPYDGEVKRELELRGGDPDAYFRDMLQLKQKYRDRIRIQVGLEIDYLPDQVDYTRSCLKEYGTFLDDALLSVHVLAGKGGWRCVDHHPEDYSEGLIAYYGSYEKVHLAYYNTLLAALKTDFGPRGPRRLGHMTLCHKFQHYFLQAGKTTPQVREAILQVLACAAETGYSLDYNVAGLFKEYCREEYLPSWVAKAALAMGIPLVYGSDAHAVSQVGRAYDKYAALGIE